MQPVGAASESYSEIIARVDDCLDCMRAQARCLRHIREEALCANAALSGTKTESAA